LSELGFTHRLRVRYHETDAQHVVYNARYLEYVDIAMTEWFRALGWPYGELVADGCDPSLVRATIEFERPALFDDELDIGVGVAHVGTSSFTLDYEVRRAADGERVAALQIVYVNLDPVTGRSRPVPNAVRERMAGQLPKETTSQ
jgi:acyl-CoA thioester hydrolase